MADNDVLAVTGENVFLLIQGIEQVTGPVNVSFQLRTDGPEIITLDFWDESLVAEAADPAAPGQAGSAGRIPWTVNLNGQFTMPKSPAISIIFFSVTGKSASGKTINVKAANRLLIPAFKVTSNARLRKLMTHEFPKPKGQDFAFDEAPLQAELDALTPQQRKLLATADPGPEGNRLVTFITLVPESDRRMHADTCQADPFSIKPNATFAVFHCQGAGKEVSLVCFTRYFVFNMINPETNGLVHGAQGKQKADAWLSRANLTPPQFKIGCFARPQFTDGTLWNRVYAPNGNNIMGGNTMHGIINTVGCWMLFRNYNFPKQGTDGKPIEDEMDRILNRLVRHMRKGNKGDRAQVLAALKAVGYDDNDSIAKFTDGDANHAYAMFFRYVVGVRFFSETMFKRNLANDKFAHQRVFAKKIDKAVVDKYVADNGDGAFIYHDADDRLKQDKAFKVDDSLLGPNALGFQACKRFCDAFAKNLKKGELADRTWTDLYLYRADDLPVSKLKQAFFAKI